MNHAKKSKALKAIDEIQNLAHLKLDCTPEDCLKALSVLSSIIITDELFGELAEEAVQVKELAEEKIKEIHNLAVQRIESDTPYEMCVQSVPEESMENEQ